MPPAKKAAPKRSAKKAARKANAPTAPARKTPRKAARAPAPAGRKKTGKKAARKSPARKPAAASALRFGPAEPDAARRTARILESVAADRVLVENVNVPGHTTTVDGPKYRAMRRALLKVLPKEGRGLTQTQMFRAVKPHLPQKLFPGGAKAEWWAKCVQLDLEAKRIVERDAARTPTRWRQTAGGPATPPAPRRKRALDHVKSSVIRAEMAEAAARGAPLDEKPATARVRGTIATAEPPREVLRDARRAKKAKPTKRAKKATPAKRGERAKRAKPAKKAKAAKRGGRRAR